MAQTIYPRPVGGGPRPGGGSGGGAAVSFPAERPRLMELQIDAGAFGMLIMNRMRAETICAGQEFQLSKDGPVYVVDHVEFDQPATLGDPPPHHRSGLQLIITAGIFLKHQTDLLDPSKTDTFANLNPAIKIYFNVASHAGEICLSYNTVTSVVAIPEDALAALDGILQSLNLCTALDLSALPSVLGDLTAAKAKVATDSDFSILSVRLQLGDSPANQGPWGSFANSPVESFLAGLDWGILLHSGLVVGAFEQLVAGMTLTRDDISVASGPVGKWHSGSFEIAADNNKHFDGGVSLTLSGDSWAALGCDIGFSAIIKAGLSVPAKNTINATIGLDISPNYWDAFLCFGPIGDIAAAAKTFEPDPNDIPSACTLKNASLIVCNYPVNLAPLTLGTTVDFGSLVLDKYFATSTGPVLGGKLDILQVGKPQLHTHVVNHFSWGILGTCGEFRIGTQAELKLTGSEMPGGPNVTLCKSIQVLNDPLNIFAPRMVIQPGADNWLPLDVTFNFEPGDLPLDSPYWQNPYPLVLLVETSGGCRTVSLGKVPAYTEQQINGLGLRMPELEANCDAPQTGLFGTAGQFDPHWLVDPAPEGYANVWESLITDATPGDAFTLSDASGVIARSVVGADRRAELTSIFPASGALRVNRIAASGTASATTEARSAAGGKTAAPADASAPRLRERQVELRRRREIDLKHEITFLAADRLDGTPILIAGAGGDLTVFDISSPALPQIIGQATAAHGAVAAGNDLIYWGEHGLSFWSRETHHETAVSACLRIGGHLAALTDRGLELFDAALQPAGHLNLPNRGMLVSVKRRLLVAVPDGLAVVDVASPAKPTLVGTAPVEHIGALSAWGAPKAGGTVTLRISGDGFVTLDANALPAVKPLATYQRRPWAFGAARLGNWWARLEDEHGRIGIYTPGRSQTTYGS